MKEFIEKLIRRLEERLKFYENRFEELRGTERDAEDWGSIKSYKDTIEIVNELAEEYNNGWIPCSERLPSVGVTVLCYWKKYDRYDNTTSYYYSLMHRNEDCQWLSDLGMCNGEVIAWQPLPEPYTLQQKKEWQVSVMKHFTKVE